jgi:hypothetical protein
MPSIRYDVAMIENVRINHLRKIPFILFSSKIYFGLHLKRLLVIFKFGTRYHYKMLLF